MNLKTIIVACLWMLLTFSGSAQQLIATDTSNVTSIRIDPSNAMGGSVSDIFDEVHYIPLETNAESLLGDVSQLEILNGYYVILDHDKNAIFIFTTEGKYHAKIKGKPNVMIYKFIVNRWTNQIVYSSDNYQSMTYCDLDGKIIKTEKNMSAAGNPSIYISSSFISADQLISYDQYRDIAVSSKYYTPYTRSLLRFGTPIHSIGMPYSTAETKIDVISHGIGPLTSSGNDTTFLFAKPYDYALYTVSPHAIKLTYKLIFPQQLSLPSDFLSNPKYDLKRLEFLQNNKTLIYSLNNCYQIGTNLLFEASAYRSAKEDNLLYNLTSANLIALKHVLPDERSFYLPIYDHLSSNFENVGFAYCDGVYIYTSLSSLCMFKANEKNSDKNVHFSGALESYFKERSIKDNPVIVQLKVKAEL